MVVFLVTKKLYENPTSLALFRPKGFCCYPGLNFSVFKIFLSGCPRGTLSANEKSGDSIRKWYFHYKFVLMKVHSGVFFEFTAQNKMISTL